MQNKNNALEGLKPGEAREQLIIIGRELAAKGLISGRSGNVSARLSNGNILISATHTMLGRLEPDDLVEIDINGDVIRRTGNPSSEKLMHLEIYKSREDVSAIVHTHSQYASAYAYLKKSLRSISYEHDLILGDMQIVEYIKPGTLEFALAVKDALLAQNAVLLQKHGVVAVGQDPFDALSIAELVEDAAKINYLIDTIKTLG